MTTGYGRKNKIGGTTKGFRPTRTVYGLGTIGHGLESGPFKLPQWTRIELNSLYKIRYGFY